MIDDPGWSVRFCDEFSAEFDELSREIKKKMMTSVMVLKEFGPQLGRPYVDTLIGSEYPNMKELRFEFDGGVWRVAFAFDPDRQGILLVAGDKAGVNQRRFYRDLIREADARYGRHLGSLEE